MPTVIYELGVLFLSVVVFFVTSAFMSWIFDRWKFKYRIVLKMYDVLIFGPSFVMMFVTAMSFK